MQECQQLTGKRFMMICRQLESRHLRIVLHLLLITTVLNVLIVKIRLITSIWVQDPVKIVLELTFIYKINVIVLKIVPPPYQRMRVC
jgi:hypothetical protein